MKKIPFPRSLSRFLAPFYAAFLPAALLATSGNLHAQAFTGTFTFDGTTGNTNSFAYNGTPIPGITVSALTKNGATTSSSTGNFRASAWPTGATNGSDVFTGTLDPTKFFEFTVTAAPGKVINLPGLTFGLGRSSTGPRQWQWRSSVDAFAAPIPATTLNAGVSQDAGVLTVPDLNSNWTGNIITTAGASYENLTSLTFRIYAYNAEAPTGTGGLQGPLTFSGTLADAAPVDTSILLGVDPAAVDEGQSSSGTVTLGSAAGAGGVTITLASSDASRATVPATVFIPQGQTSVGFTVTTIDDGVFVGDDIVTITANATGYTQGLTFITVRNTTPVPVLAMSLTAKETPATQNFDGLGTANTTSIFSGTIGVQTSLGLVPGLSSVSGWYGTQSGGTNTSTASILTANDGSANGGGAYNYGSTNAPANLDRALGSLGSGSRVMTLGALISNNSSQVIDTVVLSFTAKIWRRGAVANTMTFGYGKIGAQGTSADFLTSPSALPLGALNITTPPAGTAAQQDGNLPENQIQFTEIPIVGVNLAPGETMFIRWADDNASGEDSGVGIDNFSVYGTDAPALAAPVMDPPSGVYFSDQTVRFSNFASYPPGIQVRYTTDGSEPGPSSLLYDNVSGIQLLDGNGPVTLKAVAINPATSQSSFPTAATYEFPVNVANLTALKAAPTGLIYRVTGQVTFTAGTSFRNTKFFQDTAAGIQIDDPGAIVTTVYAAGDNVANITGRLTVFNGQFQLTPSLDFGAPVSTGNTVTPTPVTLETLSDAVQSMLVVLDDVTFQNAGTVFGGGGTTTPIADPSTAGQFTGVFRNIFGDSDITGAEIPAGPNTLTGIVQRTSATVITVGPPSLADIVFTGTPALSIQSSKLTLDAGQTGEAAEATVEIRRSGDTSADLVVDLTQSVPGAFAADVDGSFNYVPLPTTTTIPAGSSAVLIFLVASESASSFAATLTASADGLEPASQEFWIQGSEAPVSVVEVTGAAFNAFTTTEGTPSAAQTVSVSGSGLTGNLTVTAPAGFEVSADGVAYASSAALTPSSGTVAATTISVRLSGAAAGTFTGDVSFASAGAATQTRAVSGTVGAAPPPSVPIAITPGASVTQNFTSLSTNAIATLPSGWKVDKNTTVRTVGTYAAAGTATERAGGANLSSSAGNGIYNFGSSDTDRAVGGLSSGSGSQSVNLYAALQNTSGTAISSLSVSYNAERYRNGSNPAGFSIQLYYSTDGTTWTSAGANFLSSFAPNADNNGAATVPIETLAVTSQTLPLAVPAGSTVYLAWNYSVTTGTTTTSAQAIGVSDIEITAAGANTPAITSISPTSGAVGATVTITGSNFGPTPAVRFNGIAAASSVNPEGTEITATVPAGATTGPITVEVAGQSTATSPVNFTVVDPFAPTLSTTGTLNPFSTTTGTPSASQSFTVSGANLTGNATITAPAGFEVSSDDATFGPSATLTPTSGTLTDVPVYVRIAAAAPTGAVSGNVSVAATGATTQNVPVSGAVNAVATFVTLTTTSPGSYTQNFDSLGTTTISNVVSPTVGVQTSLGSVVTNTLDGWYAGKIAGTNSVTTGIVANNGSGNSGAVYNYGSTNEPSNTDRSLGSLASGGLIPGFGALIKNETGQTLESVQISFTAKFWRSSTVTNNTLTFGYGLVGASEVTTGNFLSASNATALPAANIVGPAPVATNGPLDGNDLVNQQAFSNVTVPVTLAPGEAMFIRWQDANEAGNDAGLAIDNVSITAVAAGTTPVVTVTGAAFNAFSTTEGTPSSPQTVSVSGSNLAGDLTVTAPAGFAVSSDGVTYASSVGLTPTGGSVAETTISVRLTGAAAGEFSGNVSFASTGATTQNRAVGGTVSGGSAYDTWADSFGLDPATNGAPTADPDGDSFTNEQEYAFGTSPIVANGALLGTTASGGNLVVTWLERSDVTYNVQSSSNLRTTPFANDGTVIVVNGPASPTPPAGYTRKQFSVPTTGAKFYRVSATVPAGLGGASASGGTLTIGGPAPGGGQVLVSNPPLTTEGAGTLTLGGGNTLTPTNPPSTDSGTSSDFGSSTVVSEGTLPEGFDPAAGTFTITSGN